VTAVGGEGVTVVGDNPAASTDSRTFGPVPPKLVRGRVVYRYWPEGRRGRILRP
jgi:type IV secretory pathway protease TraF